MNNYKRINHLKLVFDRSLMRFQTEFWLLANNQMIQIRFVFLISILLNENVI